MPINNKNYKHKYSDKMAEMQVLACLIKDPMLFTDNKYKFNIEDFGDQFHRILFGAIENIALNGAQSISYIDIDQFLNKYPMAMTSHVLLKNIDSVYPVTMSKKAIKSIIRNYLDFDGFLISDAIDMRALKGNMSEKVSLCLSAGIDAICYCSGQYKDLYDICREKRFMTEKAQIRFANIKKVIHNTKKEIDTSDVEMLYLQKFKNKLNEIYKYDATEVLQKMLEKGEN